MPSIIWAVMAGFTQPAEILAMLLVVGGFILSFALGTAWLAIHTTRVRVRVSWALKTAAAIKAATLTGAAGWWTISISFLPQSRQEVCKALGTWVWCSTKALPLVPSG